MKIGAVIVVYNFEQRDFTLGMRQLAEQVDQLCVVDNSAKNSESFFSQFPHTVYIPLHENKGIAYAQNAGIKRLIEEGTDYILFSDQDSLIPQGAVKRLIDDTILLEQQGWRVGGVCPRAYNADTGEPYPHQVNKMADRVLNNGANVFTEVTFCMNSMSLIKAEWFKKVGLMETELFIDGVDSEWCWRAANMLELRFFVDESLHMQHHLGIGNRKIGGKIRSMTPPGRMYYQYRNYIWLLRRKYVPRKWKIYNGWKYLIKIAYYGMFVAPRLEYVRKIMSGVAAGCHIQKEKDKTNRQL